MTRYYDNCPNRWLNHLIPRETSVITSPNPMVSMTVLIEPLWKLHSLHRSMVDYPPASYRFIIANTTAEKTSEVVSKSALAYRLQRAIEKTIPLNLFLAYFKSLRRRPKADLIYSHSHLVLRNEPWILDLEYANLLVSPYPEHFRRYRKIVQKYLESRYCRKILCETSAGKNSLLKNLDPAGIVHKTDILPVAVQTKHFVKRPEGDKIRFLFVGSANILGEFDIKGGREVLESFVILQQKYRNLQLVIRSDVPGEIQRYCEYNPDIGLIKNRISWDSLEREFQTADIFFLPAHNTPFLAFLDAMSYELPVLTIDAWANREFIDDGKTGLTAKSSDMVAYVSDEYLPLFGTPCFANSIKRPDPAVVEDLVRQASILIEQPFLRRMMGAAGRWEVEHGRFSMRRRNEKLRRIFDEAIEDTIPQPNPPNHADNHNRGGDVRCSSGVKLR